MSSSTDLGAGRDDLRDAATALERCARDCETAATLDPATLQRLLAASLRTFVRHLEGGARLKPFPQGRELEPTATDILVAVTQMLAASQIELFELGMWQTWGSVGVADEVTATATTVGGA